MAIKLKSNSAYDGQLQETNTAARQYYLPNNDSGLGTQLMTAQATTSGTSIDFTGIPSWVKRISIMFNGVSTNGVSPIAVQIGSGSITSSGYSATATSLASSGYGGASFTTAFPIINAVVAAASYSGTGTLCLVSTNTWVFSAVCSAPAQSGTPTGNGAGVVSLSGTLDRVRITTSNGTDTFDSGSVNLLIE